MPHVIRTLFRIAPANHFLCTAAAAAAVGSVLEILEQLQGQAGYNLVNNRLVNNQSLKIGKLQRKNVGLADFIVDDQLRVIRLETKSCRISRSKSMVKYDRT